MNKGIRKQEEFNDALLEMMCVTFNKKQMKQLLEIYIKSNKLTEDMLALENDLKESKIKTEKHLEKYNKLKSEINNFKQYKK